MVYQRMLFESKRLEKQIDNLQQQIKDLPKGKFICAKNGKNYKWYISDGTTQTYLPKSERALAEKLAMKKYMSCVLADLLQEKKAIDFYLRHHTQGAGRAEQMLLQTPEYEKLLKPYFKPISQELQEWCEEPFISNPKHPENLIFKTVSGGYVRSKSELIIDMLLTTHKIPFRYEAPLQMNGFTIYPDFTIRHPKTGKFFYWEHFGLADEPTYQRHMISKLQAYTENGIIPSISLITTYETKENPLSPEAVEKIIEYYFL